jgi:hypothetical protein
MITELVLGWWQGKKERKEEIKKQGRKNIFKVGL